jgi:hypothetical protein
LSGRRKSNWNRLVNAPKKNGQARKSAKKIRWGRMNRYGVMLKPRRRTAAVV